MRRGNTAQNTAYTGVNGEVTVDLQAKTLRIHDGTTVGGFAITAGGGSYSNTNVTAYIPTDPTITSIQANVAAANAAISAIAGIDTNLIANAATQQTQINLINANVSAANALIPNLLAVSGNIIPSANVTYSLGNQQFQWRDLWVSNNTIYIGNTPIRVDGGTLLVNNSPIAGGASANLVNGASTFRLFANGQSQSPDTIFAANGVSIINANGLIQGGMYNSGDADFFNIGASNGRGIKFYVNEETNGPQFFANGNIQVPGSIINGTGQINFVANSSGDGYGFSTIELRPDTNAFDDSYLIIDPTYPSHIHIRAGGAQDNSLTQLFLGGENSHFKVNNGLNPDVSIAANNYVWLFGTDGSVTFPTGGNVIFDSSSTSIIDGVTNINAVGTIGANVVQVLSDLTSFGASPAPRIYGFSSIATTGSAVNEGNISASGNLVASQGAYVSGNVFAARYNFANGVNILSTVGAGSYGNTEVAAYLTTYTGNAGAARVQVTNAVDFMYGGYPYMGWQLSGSDTLKLRTNIASGDYTDDAIIVDRQSLAVNVVATLTAGNIVTTNGLFWSNGTAYSTGGGSGIDDVLRANVGAYQIYANANAAAQSISIVAINDNLISFQTYANANAATQQTSIDTKAPLASPTFSGTLTSGGNIAAQANVTVNNNLSVLGNLLVQGTTTTVNSTTLSITDKFITVANSSTNNNEANGAGIYVPGSSANILYTSVDDSWTLNKTIVGTANIKATSWVIGGVFAYANNVNILADINSNAATQALSINTLNANLGAYQAYANATFSVSTYSNTNVAGYLAGNITTGNVQVGSTMQLRGADNSIATTNGSSINIYSRVNISGSAVNVGLNVSGNLVVNQNSNATSFYGTNYFYTNGVSILSGIGGTYSNVNVEAYIGGNVGAYQVFANANAATQATGINTINANLGAYQTFANANAATQATSINTINANLGAFQTYANTTFGVSSYSNTQVAAYLLTYPNVNVATLNTTSGNIVTLRTANFNSANAVISGGYISALTNASIVTATITTVNSTAGNVTTLATSNFSTANAVVTGGYATGLANISVTGNATVGNLIGASPNTTIISGAYTSTFDNVGNVVLPNVFVSGNTTAMGIAAGYAPNRPAFRIYGGTPAWWTTSNTNFKGSSIVVDYNQGGYFNSNTGVFTAPVTGLYQTSLNARIGSVNAQGQILVLKNGLNTAGNAIMMWEADTNTGTAVHFGVSTVVKLVAGDFLSANITAGNIQFDQNDSWTVTYLG